MLSILQRSTGSHFQNIRYNLPVSGWALVHNVTSNLFWSTRERMEHCWIYLSFDDFWSFICFPSLASFILFCKYLWTFKKCKTSEAFLAANGMPVSIWTKRSDSALFKLHLCKKTIYHLNLLNSRQKCKYIWANWLFYVTVVSCQ